MALSQSHPQPLTQTVISSALCAGSCRIFSGGLQCPHLMNNQVHIHKSLPRSQACPEGSPPYLPSHRQVTLQQCKASAWICGLWHRTGAKPGSLEASNNTRHMRNKHSTDREQADYGDLFTARSAPMMLHLPLITCCCFFSCTSCLCFSNAKVHPQSLLSLLCQLFQATRPERLRARTQRTLSMCNSLSVGVPGWDKSSSLLHVQRSWFMVGTMTLEEV